MSAQAPKAKSSGSWALLPTLRFTREAAPSQAVKEGRKDMAYNVRSAKTLGAEFDNRKHDLKDH
ncbi:MAG: hypothetical protein Q8Q88_21920 [Phenylobacterium sp.]|uniref:hypothetical protein n=1 Tax=Phenylobacterium sp. TaxID=1871053 RepID=UPI0027371961|nr:hypothetical protein [Phenylobacterium sp.]MDP3749697.1 hypothetical protein [Phenylobacterium sp.]